MEPSEFLIFAGKAVAFGKAGARSASSRAYYAVFHQARILIEQLGNEKCGAGSAHNLVRQYLGATGNPQAVPASQKLSDLQRRRLQADYDLNNSRAETIHFAQASVEISTEVQKLLQAFRAACETDAATRDDLLIAIQKINKVHRRK